MRSELYGFPDAKKECAILTVCGVVVYAIWHHVLTPQLTCYAHRSHDRMAYLTRALLSGAIYALGLPYYEMINELDFVNDINSMNEQ